MFSQNVNLTCINSNFNLIKNSKRKPSWNEMKNHYNALELEKNCSAKEIKDSYIKLSKKYHPDKNKSKEAEKKILEINEAYSVLKNEATRSRYDEGLHRNNSQQPKQESARNNTRKYYYNRSHFYDDYARYYQKVNNQGFAEAPSRKFTLVICCCMLMVFGAGLRIMYAWSDAYRRKRLNEMMVKHLADTPHRVNPIVEEMRLFEKKREREKTEKNSKP